MMKILANGYTYEFFPALMGGFPVIGVTHHNGTESTTEWSAEPSWIPQSEAEAAEYLDAFTWQIVEAGEDFIANPSEAQIIAAQLGGDGTRWETPDGISFDNLMNRAIRKETNPARDLTRYEFRDGSAMVAGVSGWDIEGATPFSWAEAE